MRKARVAVPGAEVPVEVPVQVQVQVQAAQRVRDRAEPELALEEAAEILQPQEVVERQD